MARLRPSAAVAKIDARAMRAGRRRAAVTAAHAGAACAGRSDAHRRVRASRLLAAVRRRPRGGDGRDGGAESHIGPILRALETRVAPGELRYIGVGPRTNFRARRWWDPIVGSGSDPSGVVPIEHYAPKEAMRASRDLYRRRHEIRRSLCDSEDLRAHAAIKGCDCWPLIRQQLAGIALLQFPWSARAMDEAAAALESTRPTAAVTYAEAGGWGRALALEARRRGIPLVGLQHGFIYRHWLNYRHEPDEMQPDARNADDRGFPRPARTLLFDDHAAAHLRDAGRFPAGAIAVTGSARLDDLTAAVRALTPGDLAAAAAQTGADDRPLVVFAAKEREARGVLPALVAAVRALPALQLAIKPHPAETAAVYADAVAGAGNIRVLAPDASLPALLGAARRAHHRQLDGRHRRARAGDTVTRHRTAEQPDAVRRRRRHAGRPLRGGNPRGAGQTPV